MKEPKRILGYAMLALGVGSVVIGSSPLFPVYAEAFIAGGLFCAVGVWLLAGPEVRESFRHLVGTWARDRRARQASSRWESRGGAGAPVDPLLAVRILRLASERGGTLTLAQVSMELNVPLSSAEAGLQECVRAGNAVADYDIAHSHPVYRFPEFTPPEG